MRGFTLGFSLAVCAVLLLPTPSLPIVAFVCVLALFVLMAGDKNAHRLVLGVVCGALLTLSILNQQLRQQPDASLVGQDISVTGWVVGVPKRDERHARFTFEVQRIDAEIINTHSLPARLQLSWYGRYPALQAGQLWTLSVRLKRPRSLGNPGSFDYARWLFQQRIHAVGYVRSKPAAIDTGQRRWSLDAQRLSLATKLAALPAANELLPLVQGLGVGITAGVTEAQWRLLRQSGTAHLMAISGLHIGLVSGFGFAFASVLWRLRARGRTLPVKQLFCSCVSVSFALAYAALAGFSLPTQRALIMLCVVLLLLKLRRHLPPYGALLLAMLVVLLIDPLAVLSAGFWLSFGTVAILTYLHQGRMRQMSGRVTQKIAYASVLHLQLGIALLPATAWFFQNGALAAPVANAVAIPLVGLLVVPLSLLCIVFVSWWPFAANLMLQLSQWLLALVLLLLEHLLEFRLSSVSVALPSIPLLFLAVGGLLLLFCPRGLHLRWLSLPLLLPAILTNVLGQRTAPLELHVLDVGQGLAALVFTPGYTLLYDTGPRISSRTSMIERAVQPFLISKGRASIDTVIISHGDNDHAGGLEGVQRHYPAAQLYTSEREQYNAGVGTACQAGTSWVRNSVTFSFLHPASFDGGSDNNRSCVLLVHLGTSRIMLSGDIEARAERQLLARLGTLPLTVLIAPHHGSRTSSTVEFVQALRPEHVVYPAGDGNAFGFPHEDVQMRYKITGSSAYITGMDGAVSFTFNRSGLQQPPTAFWRKRRRFPGN